MPIPARLQTLLRRPEVGVGAIHQSTTARAQGQGVQGQAGAEFGVRVLRAIPDEIGTLELHVGHVEIGCPFDLQTNGSKAGLDAVDGEFVDLKLKGLGVLSVSTAAHAVVGDVDVSDVKDVLDQVGLLVGQVHHEVDGDHVLIVELRNGRERTLIRAAFFAQPQPEHPLALDDPVAS